MSTRLTEQGPTKPVALDADNLISIAISQNADLDKVERLLELKMKFERDEARKAYYKSLSKFKRNPPVLKHDRTVEFYNNKNQKVRYTHASLSNVNHAISVALSKYGLSHRWHVIDEGDKIKVQCIIRHELGYEEECSIMYGVPDTSGSKNNQQARASTVTYLQRYTLLASTGLAAEGSDDDAVAADPENIITDKQLGQIRDGLVDVNKSEDDLARLLGVNSIEKLPKDMFQPAMQAIYDKRNADVQGA